MRPCLLVIGVLQVRMRASRVFVHHMSMLLGLGPWMLGVGVVLALVGLVNIAEAPQGEGAEAGRRGHSTCMMVA